MKPKLLLTFPGRWLAVGSLVVLVIGALWFASCAVKEKEAVSQPQPSTPQPAPPERPTSEVIAWETYTDPVLGFKVKYPAGWFARGNPMGGVIITSYDPSRLVGRKEASQPVPDDQYRFSLFFLPDAKPADQSLEEWAVARVKEDIYGDVTIIVAREEITIDGIRSLKLVYRSPGGEGTLVHIPQDNGVYSVSAGPNTSIYHHLLDEVLESIDLK